MRFLTNIVLETLDLRHNTISKPLDEIEMLSDSLNTSLKDTLTIPKDVLNSFKLKDKLNPEIWDNDTLNPEVREKLLRIASDFIKDLNLPKGVKINDIILTGSLANYNWSKFSDIDLHIVLDFNQFDSDPKILDDYFYAQKAMWNKEHEIDIFKYPVELYVQDINSDLAATAVYSILRNKWIKKPRLEKITFDTQKIKDKALSFIDKLKDIRQDYEEGEYQSVVNKTTAIKDKVKRMRTSGLEQGGESSIENLVFKTLRRTSFMELIDSYKTKAYDKLMSISENLLQEDHIFKVGGVLLIKGAILENQKQRLYVTTTKNISSYSRYKANDEEGKSAGMAILGNQVYKLTITDGKLRAQGVAWSSEGSQLSSLGLKRRDVVLNNNKTPLHWETLKTDNIAKALSENSLQILSLPNISWD